MKGIEEIDPNRRSNELAICEATKKEAHRLTICEVTKKEAKQDGVWASIAEYSRITRISKTTLKLWNKKNIFPGPVRKSLKARGQKGSGYEIYVADEKNIKILLGLREIRSAGLDDKFKEKTSPSKTSRTVKIKVSTQIYLAGDTLKNKLSFTDYLTIVLNQGQSLVHKHKQIVTRVGITEHKTVKSTAREAGLPIMDVYRSLYEQYVTSLYNND